MLLKKVASVLLILSLTLPSLVEARAGSTSHGGYGGSRGSFGGSGYHGQSYQGGGYNYNPQPVYRAPYAPQAGYGTKRSGGFFSGLFSGILGTYIYNKVLNPSHPGAATTTPAASNQAQGYNNNNPQATTTTTTATTAAPPQFSFFRILLLAALAYFIWRMVTRRRRKMDSQNQQQSFSNQAPPPVNPQKMNLRDFFNVLGGTGAAGAAQQGQGQVSVSSQDSQTFENLLLSIQDAWTHNNLPALSRLTTPEMHNNFVNIMRENQQQNLNNSISHVKLLNQAVQDTWQEGTATFARVAMTWSAIDYMVNTTLSPSDPGYLVEGNLSEPSTVTELWTFRKDPQNPWVLSDIQQP